MEVMIVRFVFVLCTCFTASFGERVGVISTTAANLESDRSQGQDGLTSSHFKVGPHDSL